MAGDDNRTDRSGKLSGRKRNTLRKEETPFRRKATAHYDLCGDGRSRRVRAAQVYQAAALVGSTSLATKGG